MGKKWKRVDPATIKVGDRVRTTAIDKPDTYDFTVIERGRQWIGIFALGPSRTWYIRKPKRPKLAKTLQSAPLTRPDEPPVGTFFRVDRTGQTYQRYKREENAYLKAPCAFSTVSRAWSEITEPGDTWTRLELMEVRG